MKKNTLETLGSMVEKLEDVINSEASSTEYLDLDIQKSVTILRGKIEFYLSNYDTLETLKRAGLGQQDS